MDRIEEGQAQGPVERLGRWATLVGCIGNLTVNARRALVGALSDIAASGPGEAFRSAIWPEVHETVSRHREFRDTDWALPESELELFDPILECLRPAAPADAYGWLFSSDLVMVDGKRWADDHEAHSAALAAKRARSVADIFAAGGISAVLELTDAVDVPCGVGVALATNGSAALDNDMLEAMHDDLDSGLIIAVRNQRGGTTRSPTEGGGQERELAARYRAQGHRFSQWPRTAAIFDSLASSYEDEAAVNDRRAEARRLGL